MSGMAGRRRLAVHVSAYHASSDFALDYRTGEVIEDPGDGRRTVEDLDRIRPQRRLCRPLTRTAGPTDDEDIFDELPAFEPFTYTRPYGIDHGTLALRLQRCGAARAVEVLRGRL